MQKRYDHRPYGRPRRKRGGFFSQRWVKAASIIVGVIVVLAIAVIIIFNNIFGGMKQTKLDVTDLGISEEATKEVEEEKLNNIINIALFGIDTTDGAATIGDQYRSDCIIVFTIDPLENKLKMTSILRDTKVPIDGHDPQKINAAYKYGGPQLAVKTVNQNFKTNIRDYITVDFAEMAEIIDLVGGLTIEITDAEAQNMMLNNTIKPVTAGTHLLDGPQSVAYARVRKVDSDYYRASRQQKVLTLLFDKLKAIPSSEYPSLIKSFLKCVETSLSYNDILKLARSIDLKTAKIIKNTIPDPQYEAGLWGGVDNTGSWVWVYDLDAAADRLHKIIYGGFDEKETVKPGSTSPNFGGGSSGTGNNSDSNSSSNISSQTETQNSGTQDAGNNVEGNDSGNPGNEETISPEEDVIVPEETSEQEGETEEQVSEVILDPWSEDGNPEPPVEDPTDPPVEDPTDPSPEPPVEDPADPPVEQPVLDSSDSE